MSWVYVPIFTAFPIAINIAKSRGNEKVIPTIIILIGVSLALVLS